MAIVRKMKVLRALILEACGRIACAGFYTAPAKLFKGVDQRIALVMARKGADDASVWMTKHHLWTEADRPNLLRSTRFRQLPFVSDAVFPQVGDSTMEAILAKMSVADGAVRDLVVRKSEHTVVYHRSPRYFTRALLSFPYFIDRGSRGRTHSTDHWRTLSFRTQNDARAVGAMVCSSFMFMHFLTTGNCRNLTSDDIVDFPIGDMPDDVKSALAAAFEQHTVALLAHSRRKSTAKAEWQEFQDNQCMDTLRAIDKILAVHYGLTDKERIYVEEYEKRYRMLP